MSGYFNSGNPKLDELVDKLVTVTAEHIQDRDIVLTALQKVLVFYMSTVCRNCRKDIGRQLKRDIPHMMVEAGVLAAGVSDKLRTQHDTTHH